MSARLASLLALAALVWLTPPAAAQNQTLVAFGSDWKYLADGTDQGNAWQEPAFDDSTWTSAPTEIGYGDGGENTVITPPPEAITTYFRRTFDVADPAAITKLMLRLHRDDGAVVYLNGAEINRTNMPAGAVTASTLAAAALSSTTTPTESDLRVWFFTPPTGLVAGSNLLAVEIHQSTATDADHSFNLEMIASTAAAPAFVMRGPYLQSVVTTSAVIRWRTEVATGSRVVFGAAPNALTNLVENATPKTEHELTLTGLQPDTKYFYAIGDAATLWEGGDAQHYFTTMPLPGPARPVRIWAIGDSGTGGDGRGRAELVRDSFVNSPLYSQPDLWLMLGDNAYDSGKDSEYQKAVFDGYRALLRHTPLWSCIGNHETYSGQPTPPYYDIFTLPTNAEGGGLISGTEAYYSFDFANVHFVCLDSQTDASRQPGSAMLAWLEADLAATTQRWIIAFWHHPPYTKGSHNSDAETELIEMRANAVPILEAGGVDLVLNGHSHVYERSLLLHGHHGLSGTLTAAMKKDAGDGRETGDGAYGKDPGPDAGAVFAVAGSSGRVSNWTDGSSAEFNPNPHPVMIMSLRALGSLLLDIDGDRLDARFLDKDGAVRDHFTLSKAPLVTVTSTQPALSENGPQAGSFRLSRTRDLDQPISITLARSGTATAPADYDAFASVIAMPAGAASVTVPVTPLADSLAEGPETIIVTADLGTGYRIHRDTRAVTLTIADKPYDDWRFAKFGADANDPAIAGDTADPDGDGQDNLREFIAGTEPRDSASVLRATALPGLGGEVLIRFTAMPDRGYTVQFKDDLSAPQWQKLTDVAPAATVRELEIADPGASAQPLRFYRVVTPQQP